MKTQEIDRPWEDYPIGTRANAVMGGYWVRMAQGWKWCTGDTFPRPGGDAVSVTLPNCQECDELLVTEDGEEICSCAGCGGMFCTECIEWCAPDYDPPNGDYFCEQCIAAAESTESER